MNEGKIIRGRGWVLAADDAAGSLVIVVPGSARDLVVCIDTRTGTVSTHRRTDEEGARAR